MSHRKHMVTLHGEGTRCTLKPGMNEVKAADWEKVKKHPAVAKMVTDKMLEEKGAVVEKKKAVAKPVAEKAETAEAVEVAVEKKGKDKK